MRFPFELTTSPRIIRGRKDPSRFFSIIEGLVTFPDGKRAFMEALLPDQQVFAPGQYELEISLDTDRQRRLTAFVRALHPRQKAAA
jgi:hypothetical protein